jgi:hypothetical protein
MTTNLMGPAKQNEEKITIIKTQFFSALDDFKKYYVYYNKNPEVNEFQNYYTNSKSQIQSMTKDLFLLTNSIDKSIENLDSQMQVVSLKLEDEKNLNVELTKLFKDLNNTKNGSELLINDSKEEYNQQYYYNWEMIIGILIAGGLLTFLFKSKTPPSAGIHA